jgi:hypothetical protein
MLVLFGVATFAVLWIAGVARTLWTTVGAALMLGAAGYAIQERAGLPGHPVQDNADPVAVYPQVIELRDQMLGRFTGDGAYLIASDALMRSGSRDSGARIVLMGANQYPRSLTLWTGLGTAIPHRRSSRGWPMSSREISARDAPIGRGRWPCHRGRHRIAKKSPCGLPRSTR